MLAIALTLLPFIKAALELVPVAVAAGKEVAPLITGARASLEAIGTMAEVRTNEDFLSVDAICKSYEDRHQAAVAAHLAAVAALAEGNGSAGA